MNWTLIGILFAVALVCCAVGFKRFVWFMSVGYGFAVAGIAVAALLYGAGNQMLTIPLAVALLVCALLFPSAAALPPQKYPLFREETKNGRNQRTTAS